MLECPVPPAPCLGVVQDRGSQGPTVNEMAVPPGRFLTNDEHKALLCFVILSIMNSLARPFVLLCFCLL